MGGGGGRRGLRMPMSVARLVERWDEIDARAGCANRQKSDQRDQECPKQHPLLLKKTVQADEEVIHNSLRIRLVVF